MMLSSVDLPLPECPSRTRSWPSSTSSVDAPQGVHLHLAHRVDLRQVHDAEDGHAGRPVRRIRLRSHARCSPPLALGSGDQVLRRGSII